MTQRTDLLSFYGKFIGMPFNIPMANEFGHWTSPINFIFLRSFFGAEEERFTKPFSPLFVFNPRIAQLMGIRIVVTDAEDIPGGTKIYERSAGNADDLQIFRIDDINLGQYSPTRPLQCGNGQSGDCGVAGVGIRYQT